MGCGGSKEADGDKEKDVKAKADADAAAKAKAAADAAAAAKAKADADAAAAAAAPPTPTDGKLARSSSTGGKAGGARSSAGGKGGASPRPSSGSKAPRGAQQPTPADHEANSSRDAPLVASRPDVDLNGAVDEAAVRGPGVWDNECIASIAPAPHTLRRPRPLAAGGTGPRAGARPRPRCGAIGPASGWRTCRTERPCPAKPPKR